MSPYQRTKHMTNKKINITIKTNLDNATPEEWERFMKNLIEAHRILYRRVLERKTKEILRLP